MEIKQLIKQYTTKRPPVATPDERTDFEDELFEVFLDQLGRVFILPLGQELKVSR
jgi:hypothetical protein